MHCYKLQDGILRLAQDPIGDGENDDDYLKLLSNAGYRCELTSLPGTDWETEITLYSTAKVGEPRYYLDVSGRTGQIAVLLADDFPGLLAVLKEIQPLILLFQLDQRGEIHTSDKLAMHPAL